MLEFFAIASVVLMLVAAPPYILDTLHHKTKPERATWLILSVLGLIGFFSQLSIESNWSLVFLGIDTLASLTIFVLAIPYGVAGFNLLDRYALATATIGVAISIIERQPLIALLGIILADFAGTFLTVKKAYEQPGTETTISWLLVGCAAIFGTLAVGRLDFDLLIWPLYLAFSNLAVPAAQFLSYSKART
jgi:hypothetical protein